MLQYQNIICQNNPSKPQCTHITCNCIYQARLNDVNIGRSRHGYGGVACAILHQYDNQIWTILLGYERGGQYKGQYNLFSGSVDQNDNGCYLVAIVREIFEESTLNIPLGKTFDDIFKGSFGKIRFIMHNGTPVFIGVIHDISRKNINHELQLRIQDTTLHYSMKEISFVEWFDLQNESQIEGKTLPISEFASSIVKKIKKNRY